MRIDKDKPLPPNTKLDYNLCRAKLILEALFSERYPNLFIDDKPDLQGEDVGIEVTIAADQDHFEALGNWQKAYHCDDEKKKKRAIERMAQLGVEYSGGIQAWPGMIPTFLYCQRAIDAKIMTINKGGYAYYPKYELFIFDDTWYTDNVVENARDYMLKQEVKSVFAKVYILSEGTNLFVFDLSNNSYQKITVDTDKQYKLSSMARTMVEEAEELCNRGEL